MYVFLICLGVVVLTFVFYASVKITKYEKMKEYIDDINRADDIIRKAEKEFDRKYKNTLQKK